LCQCLAEGHALLSAPTGSGKTTGVPLALLDADWLQGRSILMLEPRRPAARMAAARMAAMLGETVGETVGHQVRFERRVGPNTRIQVLTEGILTRRIQHDPELGGCGLLIFDEFHERSLQADLGLALALDVASLRDDLRILVMSATLDSERLAGLLGDAPVIRGAGRSYPVELHYLERPERDPLSGLLPAVRRALTAHSGDLLLFLPGASEIQRIADQLKQALDASAVQPSSSGQAQAPQATTTQSGPDSSAPKPSRAPSVNGLAQSRAGVRTRAPATDAKASEVEILSLHGSLPLSEQDRALRPAPDGRRRVVLATDIAETSLTIEGIEVVIDSGLTRKPRFQPGTGLTRLITQPISQASAEQRAGRAGRLGPGHCYRLWSQDQQQARPAQRSAEILEADLAPLVLELALWGVTDPSQLRWLDPPPSAAWAQAVELLQGLQVLEASGAITPAGRGVAALPVHPRLGRMLTAAPISARGLACDLAALIEERDPWQHRPGHWRPVDLQPRLDALERARRRQPTPDFEPRRLRAVQRAATQFKQLAAQTTDRIDASIPQPDPAARPEPDPRHTTPSLGALLALAYPERIARRREGRTGIQGGIRYLLRNGSGAELPRDDALASEPWLVIAELEATRNDHRIRAAAAITETEVRTAFAEQIRTNRTLSWDAQREAVIARDQVQLGAILLDAQPAPLADAEDGLALLLAAIAGDLERSLSWTAAAQQLCARVELARRLQPEAHWPDFSVAGIRSGLEGALDDRSSDEGRPRSKPGGIDESRPDSGTVNRAGSRAGSAARAEETGREHWLVPWLIGKTRLSEVRALDLLEVLRQALGWDKSQALDTLAPTRLQTPAGTWRPIDYTAGEQPVLQVPMQELFGVRDTPRIFNGRQPLLLHLLSPAGRPLQVTQDLAAFWSDAYTEVRKEMRGRYPKHHWPQDPAGEPPIKGGLKRHAR
ncbi:ATP-dependent RNA helicase, partial [Halochromatium sp.]